MAKAEKDIKLIAENRKARFDYFIEDTIEAGLVLRGSEVKSLRAGQIQLKDSYVVIVNEEAFLQNAHISEYKASSYLNHATERLRKLLMHREQIDRLARSVQEKGLSCVPLRIYFKNGRVKVEIAVVRGKKMGDKRDTAKNRDAQREIDQVFKKSR